MAIRTINWPATVTAVQAVLDGPPSQTPATLASGVSVREAVKAAGATYDVQSTDGISNVSAYAASVQAWSAGASPAWVETDRVCRAVYKLVPPPSPLMLGAFGMPGVSPWQKVTAYTALGRNGAVVPTVATGFNYFATASGTSDASLEPSPWPVVLGQTVSDDASSRGHHTLAWKCVAAINGPSGGQPIALPWDLTLVAYVTLLARVNAATLASSTSPGLSALLAGTFAALGIQLAGIPTPDPTQDALSVSATNALNTAIANANAWVAASSIQ